MSDFLGVRAVAHCRKAHQCAWCTTMIPCGEPAIRQTWVDGPICQSYMHPECDEAESRDRCYAIPGWLDEDARCGEDHARGCTCDETRVRQEGETVCQPTC